jgi:hypothetical protein
MHRSNPGDWLRLDGLTIRNVAAMHGSGTVDKLNGGPAMGFMIHFENGLTVYFAGSTALTMDMQLWGMLYEPDVAILPISNNRDPQDVVHMVRLPYGEPEPEDGDPPPPSADAASRAPTPAAMEAALKAAALPVIVLNPDLSKAYS